MSESIQSSTSTPRPPIAAVEGAKSATTSKTEASGNENQATDSTRTESKKPAAPTPSAQDVTEALGTDVNKAPDSNSKPNQVMEPPAGTNEHLATYLRQPPANESTPPELFSEHKYTSASVDSPNIKTDNMPEVYIAATLPTSEKAKELAEGGVGNAFVQGWRDEVANAVEANGGLGNSENGFLAWSKEGFVRLRNPNLSPEQNRKLAEMSLTMGIKVEDMPSRTWNASYDDPKTDKWVNDFIGNYDKELADFRADPKNALEVKDGKHRYVMKMNEEAGIPVSYHFKKKGGFGGWVQKQMKWLSPVINVAGAVLAPITGGLSMVASTAIDTGLKYAAYGKAALKNWGSIVGSALAPYTGGISAAIGGMIDKGKVTFSSIAGAVTGYLGSRLGLGTTANAALQTAGQVAAEAADTGKVRAETIASGLISALPENSFGKIPDATVHEAIKIGARAIDTGKIRAEDVLGALSPVLNDVLPEDWNKQKISESLSGVARAIDKGDVSAQTFFEAIAPFIKGSDLKGEGVVLEGLAALANAIDGKDIKASRLLKALYKEIAN